MAQDWVSHNVQQQIAQICSEYARRRESLGREDIEELLRRVPPAFQLDARIALLRTELALGSHPSPEDRQQLAQRFGLSKDVVEQATRAIQGDPTRAEGAKSCSTVTGTSSGQGAPYGGAAKLLDYELLECLGNGGMGVVYRARHRILDRYVALKLIPCQGPDASLIASRFAQEAKAIGKIEHANIVEVYDAGVEAGHVFLVMKLLEGLDVHELVRRLGPLPVPEACELVRQAADGLDAIHDKRIVHRDIKPSNLFLTKDGVLKLLDFGLARIRQDSAETSGEKIAAPIGTAEYMAPEQCRQTNVSEAADIYSLGGVLYCLLAGHAPYAHYQGTVAKLAAQCHEPLPDLRAVRPDVPSELWALICRMMHKEPERRLQSAKEVSQALEQWSKGADLRRLVAAAQKVPPPPPSPSSPPAPPPGQPSRFRTAVLWTAAMVLALVIGATATRLLLPTEASPYQTPPEPIISTFQVMHWSSVPDGDLPVGTLGEQSFGLRFGDKVTVQAQFSKPAYAYLRALNADGSDQPCLPSVDHEPPRAVRSLTFPEPGYLFCLNDEPEGGLQAFLLVVSEDPLPSYERWVQQHGSLPWRRIEVKRAVVWRVDRNGIQSLVPRFLGRGLSVTLSGPAGMLMEVVRAASAREGVHDVALIAFPVHRQAQEATQGTRSSAQGQATEGSAQAATRSNQTTHSR